MQGAAAASPTRAVATRKPAPRVPGSGSDAGLCWPSRRRDGESKAPLECQDPPAVPGAAAASPCKGGGRAGANSEAHRDLPHTHTRTRAQASADAGAAIRSPPAPEAAGRVPAPLQSRYRRDAAPQGNRRNRPGWGGVCCGGRAGGGASRPHIPPHPSPPPKTKKEMWVPAGAI